MTLAFTGLASLAPILAGYLVGEFSGPVAVLTFAALFGLGAVAAIAARGIRQLPQSPADGEASGLRSSENSTAE